MFDHSTSSGRRGVEICVEVMNEWKIQEIGYNGFEKHIKPPDFKEVLANNAQLINWRKVVGNEASLDDLIESDAENGDSGENDEVMESDSHLANNDENLAKKEANTVEKIEPVAGPWANVAKGFLQALQEINVLLDTLKVTRSTYLAPLTIAVAQEEHKTPEQITTSKGFQLATRKRALCEASKIIEKALSLRQESLETIEKDGFFDELRKMRENWRVKKVNNFLFGDLGYRVYDVNPIVDLFSFRDLEYTKVDEKFINNVPWEKSLKWAQESLICQDIFTQLIRDCSNSEFICFPSDNSLIISLFDNLVLKIELNFYPFKDMEIPSKGITYLNRALREQFIDDQNRRPTQNQLFVNLPQTHLNSDLHLRGLHGLSTEEIAIRNRQFRPLAKRLIEISTHYILMTKIQETLQNFALNFSDPHFQWKFVRVSSIFSIICVDLINRGFENLGKFTVIIRISIDDIVIITKESQQFNCRRDMDMVRRTLLLLRANFMLNSTLNLANSHSWLTLHANSNALNKDGNLAPTFYTCNPTATKYLFIQYFTDGSLPQIVLRLNPNNGPLINFHENPEKCGKFNKLEYGKIFGSIFISKMDNLFGQFRK